MLDINNFNNLMLMLTYTKFLGLVIGDTLTWDIRIDQLISGLNSACYAIRAVKVMLSREASRMLHFSYVHSVVSYGIIFWNNAHLSIKIFRMPKKIKNYN